MQKPSARFAFAVLASLLAAGCASSPSPCANAATPMSAPSAPPADDLSNLSNEALVRKLLELTGADRLGKQALDSMIDVFRKMPDLPPGFIARFRENAQAEDLVARIVPLYLKHYDRETLLAVIRFYRTEHGQALVKALPAITAESMEIGKAWGAELAKKTLSEVTAAPPAGR